VPTFLFFVALYLFANNSNKSINSFSFRRIDYVSSLFSLNMLRSIAANALRARRSVAIRTFAAAGGSQVDALASANPNLDVVRYEHKNITWTTRHVQYYSESLAIGFLEMGFTAGDVVLSWMPQHFSEQVEFELSCNNSYREISSHTLNFFLSTDGSSIRVLQIGLGIVHARSFGRQKGPFQSSTSLEGRFGIDQSQHFDYARSHQRRQLRQFGP
jgi:hypothetical protein